MVLLPKVDADTGCLMLDTGCWFLDAGYWKQQELPFSYLTSIIAAH